MSVSCFPHLPRNEINFSFIYKAEFRGQSKEISSIKKVNIVKVGSCEGKSNTDTTSPSYRVGKCVRGSENYEELTSEEIGGWLKRSRTLLCKNYQLYDIWYYRKHFGITGETNWVISRFIQWEKTWGTNSPNATDSRRVSQNYTKNAWR